MNRPPTEQGAKMRRNRLLLAGAATLVATAWTASQSDDGGLPETTTPATAQRSRTTSADAGPPAARPAQPAVAATWPDPPRVEQRLTWRAALPQGLAAWSSPVPTAPPPTAHVQLAAETSAPPPPPRFPYTLIGRIDDGVPCVLLSGPRRSFGAKAHEVIDGQWRVDAIQEREVTLTWLPGNVKQTLGFPLS